MGTLEALRAGSAQRRYMYTKFLQSLEEFRMLLNFQNQAYNADCLWLFNLNM